MVKATRYFYINKNIWLKPFIFLGFVFVENKTCKYILENPQSKLCNISEVEMNNNDNNEKCAVNDTTSDNSMMPIIWRTSPKEGRKIVFTHENERPHNNYQTELESEEEFIQQENEDIDKLKSTIKRKSEKNKRQKNWKNV